MKSNTHRVVSVQGLTWVVRHPRGLRYLIGPDIYVLVSQIDFTWLELSGVRHTNNSQMINHKIFWIH